MRGLGLDLGGTATRWAVADAAGAILERGQAPAANGHLFTDAGLHALEQMLAALAPVTARHGVLGLLAGVTGLDADDPEAAQFARLAVARLGVLPAHTMLASDVALTVLTRFGPGEGAVLYAGTGSVAAMIGADGEFHRVGGYGYAIDDGGSGFRIGQQALRWLVHRFDRGEDCSTPLAEAIADITGAPDWHGLRRYAYDDPRPRIAAVARAVSRAAGSDPAADAILDAAGEELVALARRLFAGAGTPPRIALLGGILQGNPGLAARVEGELAAAPDGPKRAPEAETTDVTAPAARLAAEAGTNGRLRGDWIYRMPAR